MRRSRISRVGSRLLLLGTLLAAPAAGALTAPDALESLGDADRAALERLAAEPERVRGLALEAVLHPDTLVDMQLLQAQTSASFQQRIEALPRADQEAVWEITREPGLLHQLAASDDAPATLERIAGERPEHLRDAIRRVGAERHALLVSLQEVAADAEDRFEGLIEDLPADTREAYRELVDHPEVVTLLATHVRLAVQLGDAYRADADGTRARLAAIAEEVAQREARAAQEWKESVEEDPEAAADVEDAARAYAEENGVPYDDVTSPEVQTVVNVTVNPYPYWFGYPSWYAYSYDPWLAWYPVPLSFGFYYGPHHHGLVWFGLPSFSFVYWYGETWLGHGVHRHHPHPHFLAYLDRHRASRHYRARVAYLHHHRPGRVGYAFTGHAVKRARRHLRPGPRGHGFETSLRPPRPLRRVENAPRPGRRDAERPRVERRRGHRGAGAAESRRGDRSRPRDGAAESRRGDRSDRGNGAAAPRRGDRREAPGAEARRPRAPDSRAVPAPRDRSHRRRGMAPPARRDRGAVDRGHRVVGVNDGAAPRVPDARRGRHFGARRGARRPAAAADRSSSVDAGPRRGGGHAGRGRGHRR